MRVKLNAFVTALLVIVFGGMSLLYAKGDTPIDLDAVSVAVVLIETPKIKTVEVDGKCFELLLRNPATGETKEKIEKSIGTGTLVADANNQTFLVTADHIAKTTDNKTVIVFKVQDDKPARTPLSALLPDPAHMNWKSHATSDVAAIQLNISGPVRPLFEKHFMPIGILDVEPRAPDRSTSVVTLGFPFGLGVTKHFSPISRESKPASGLLTLPRSDTKTPQDFFLLDSPSIGGFSGAPVLTLPGMFFKGQSIVSRGGLLCLGIVHGTISDETGGKMAAITPAAAAYELLIGMGAKVPDG